MGPFEHHLRDAIELNERRRERYRELTDGASSGISRDLLRSERLLLPVARWFDRRAEPYHQAGVPVLAGLFVSMQGTPAFGGSGDPVPEEGTGRPAAGRIRGRVLTAFRSGSFTGAAAAMEREIRALAGSPCHDCMLRHLLESGLRLCTLAPYASALAEARGLPSPGRLLGQLLRLHAWGFGAAARLDRRAYPLQRRGIPILCQDVPPVPPFRPPGTVGTDP